MISIKVLNSQATLNYFFEVDAIDYVPGEDLRIVFRIFNSQTDTRMVLEAADVVTATFLDSTSTEVDIIATALDAGDLSMYYVDLTPAQTTELSITNLQVTAVTDADSKTYKTIKYNVFAKKIISGDC